MRSRLNLVKKAFAILDADGSGVVTVEDIAVAYDASQHPEVKAGKKDPKEVFSGACAPRVRTTCAAACLPPPRRSRLGLRLLSCASRVYWRPDKCLPPPPLTCLASLSRSQSS